MRPAGPVPATWRRSTPASLARRRTAGEASGFSPSARGAPAGAAGRAGAFGGRGRCRLWRRLGGLCRCLRRGLGRSRRGRLRRLRPAPALRARPPAAALPSPATFSRTIGEPTATVSPISAPSHSTSPSTGDGISTVALSVMTAASSASSRTRSPTLTCHSTSSASATPSPTSGSLMTCSPIVSGLHRLEQRPADAGRPGEIVPFLRVRIGRVPAGDARRPAPPDGRSSAPAPAPKARRRSRRSASPRARPRSGRSS